MTAPRFALARKGDLLKTMKAETGFIEKAATRAVGRAGSDLQRALRTQTRRAKLGKGLEKAWNRAVYPRRGASMNAASLVYSKAPRLHRVFDEGATITASGSRWLVLPTAEARARGYDQNPAKSAGNRPRRWANVGKAIATLGDKLAFVPLDKNRAVLVDRSGPGRKGVALFILVKRVTIKRRLDIKEPHRKAAARIAGYLAREMERAR